MGIERQHSTIPEPLRQQLDDAFRSLLRIHKAILDYERERYEQARGPVGGAGNFLQIVINDPWFAWLRPMSQLAALIDEFVMSRKPTELERGEALLTETRRLLSPSEHGGEFQRAYHRAIQESPEVATKHAEWTTSPAAQGGKPAGEQGG